MKTFGKVNCAILGSRGLVAQRYLQRLTNHSWLKPVSIIGSKSSVGKNIVDLPWFLDENRPELPNIIVQSLDNLDLLVEQLKKDNVEIIFSALPDKVAASVEESLANAGFLVISHSIIHRLKKYIPLIIPEVNSHHLEMLHYQKYGKGNLISCSNCMVVPIALTLFPLFSNFDISFVNIKTKQSLSGGGRKMLMNGRAGHPFEINIEGEDKSIISEIRRIFGTLNEGYITENHININVECLRVNTDYGHLAEIEVNFENETSAHEIIQSWQNYPSNIKNLSLPSSSNIINFVTGHMDVDKNRWAGSESSDPVFDLNAAMGVSVGEIEIKSDKLIFKVVADNTIRGASGYGVLLAELVLAEGILNIHENKIRH